MVHKLLHSEPEKLGTAGAIPITSLKKQKQPSRNKHLRLRRTSSQRLPMFPKEQSLSKRQVPQSKNEKKRLQTSRLAAFEVTYTDTGCTVGEPQSVSDSNEEDEKHRTRAKKRYATNRRPENPMEVGPLGNGEAI